MRTRLAEEELPSPAGDPLSLIRPLLIWIFVAHHLSPFLTWTWPVLPRRPRGLPQAALPVEHYFTPVVRCPVAPLVLEVFGYLAINPVLKLHRGVLFSLSEGGLVLVTRITIHGFKPGRVQNDVRHRNGRLTVTLPQTRLDRQEAGDVTHLALRESVRLLEERGILLLPLLAATSLERLYKLSAQAVVKNAANTDIFQVDNSDDALLRLDEALFCFNVHALHRRANGFRRK